MRNDNNNSGSPLTTPPTTPPTTPLQPPRDAVPPMAPNNERPIATPRNVNVVSGLGNQNSSGPGSGR